MLATADSVYKKFNAPKDIKTYSLEDLEEKPLSEIVKSVKIIPIMEDLNNDWKKISIKYKFLEDLYVHFYNFSIDGDDTVHSPSLEKSFSDTMLIAQSIAEDPLNNDFEKFESTIKKGEVVDTDMKIKNMKATIGVAILSLKRLIEKNKNKEMFVATAINEAADPEKIKLYSRILISIREHNTFLIQSKNTLQTYSRTIEEREIKN